MKKIPPDFLFNLPTARPRQPGWFAVALLMSVLTGLLSACGGSSNTRTAEDDKVYDTPVPADIAAVPDAVWKDEPISKLGNPASYKVDGETYYIQRTRKPYKARGYASWYGKDFHGNKTSSGERYNMHAMTAAHKTLPIPCYVRVTNLRNKRQVVLRVNDRGPFVDDRIIDVSYTAAVKLGMIAPGTAYVEVEALLEPPRPQIADGGDLSPESPAPTEPPQSQSAGLDEAVEIEVREVSSSTGPASVGTAAAGTATVAAAPPAPPVKDDSWLSAPEPETPPAPAAEPVVMLGRGSYLQAGAFRAMDNANVLASRLGSARLAGQIRVESGDDGLHRVRLGPYTDSEALAGDRIALETQGLKPTLVSH